MAVQTRTGRNADGHQRQQAGGVRSRREAEELGPLGARRPDRHAQSRHAGGHRRRGGPDQARRELRARHPARPQRPADRPVRRTLESDPHHAGDRNRCGRRPAGQAALDRKSTRLNSSHGYISYAVFCLKKKKKERKKKERKKKKKKKKKKKRRKKKK